MDCKRANKLIPGFLADQLSGKELRQFVEHLDQCPDCMEETTIQFLSTEGLVRLEEGATFHLDQELQMKIKMALRREKFRRRFRLLLFSVEITSIIVILFVFIYIFLI